MSKSDSSPAAPVRLHFPALHARLEAHPLYLRIQTEEHLRTFMRHHVFCVWDFQSLLKSLQQEFTCLQVPWFPTPDGEARRLVNELVLDEESDEGPDGRYYSHFEMYLEAMRRSGADTGPIDVVVRGVAARESLDRLMPRAAVPQTVAQFVRGTLSIAQSGNVPARVAAFAYGREDIIPQMFVQLVARLATRQPEALVLVPLLSRSAYHLRQRAPRSHVASPAGAVVRRRCRDVGRGSMCRRGLFEVAPGDVGLDRRRNCGMWRLSPFLFRVAPARANVDR